MKKIIILFIVSAALFAWKANSFLDPDFGLHLKPGQLILSSGIPKTDPFSYTMPNFPYVDHEWASDVFIAKLYPLVGHLGLAIIAGFLASLALLVTFYPYLKKPTIFTFTILLLTASVLYSFVSVRPLVISWLLFSLVLTLSKKWLLPPLFLLWANLHGGFGIGLLVVALTANIPIFFLSLLATLINPYGFGLWREVFITVSDPVRFKIAEWLPTIFSFSPTLITLIVTSSLVVLRYRSQLRLGKTALLAVTLVMALTSLRHLPFWALVAAPLTLSAANLFVADLEKTSLARWLKVEKFFLALCLILTAIEFVPPLFPKDDLAESRFYPEKAVSFLQNHPPSGEIFSEYGWGGYLVWKLPEKKVFVDGRMPIWRQNGFSAFELSQKIESGKVDFQPIFDQYRIDTVLISPTSKPVPPSNPILKKISDFLNSFTFKLGERVLEEKLIAAGWQKVYQDKTAVIYARP